MGRTTVIVARMLRATEASKYEVRKPRRQEVKKPRIQGAKKSCCRSLFLSFLLSFVASFLLFSFLPRLHSFLVFFMFSVFIRSCFSFCIYSFFLSFLIRPGARIFWFLLIPAREARNTVFYYKIKDFVVFVDPYLLFLLILSCFLFDPYLFFFCLTPLPPPHKCNGRFSKLTNHPGDPTPSVRFSVHSWTGWLWGPASRLTHLDSERGLLLADECFQAQKDNASNWYCIASKR